MHTDSNPCSVIMCLICSLVMHVFSDWIDSEKQRLMWMKNMTLCQVVPILVSCSDIVHYFIEALSSQVICLSLCNGMAASHYKNVVIIIAVFLLLCICYLNVRLLVWLCFVCIPLIIIMHHIASQDGNISFWLHCISKSSAYLLWSIAYEI